MPSGASVQVSSRSPVMLLEAWDRPAHHDMRLLFSKQSLLHVVIKWLFSEIHIRVGLFVPLVPI